MNKRLLFTIAIFLIFSQLYAQTEELQQMEEVSAPSSQEFIVSSWDFFFTLGPVLYVNTDSKSAPSPIKYSMGAGFDLLNNHFLTIQPKLSFFTDYYMWDGEYARPVEIENRTALVLSFLLDLQATHIWTIHKNAIQAGAGVSFLLRTGFLAGGVDSQDTGGTPETTAGDDVKKINSYFMSGTNFFYPSISLSWLRQLESGRHAGVEARFYIPLGALSDGRGLDSAMASLAFRICNR